MNVSRPTAVAVLLLAGWSADAEETPPALVRAALKPTGEVWVGQRVTLSVDLLSPTFFASAGAFEVPPVSGAVIVKPEEHAVVSSEDVNGTTYTVQRHEFAVFAERAGTIRLPPIPVRFSSSGGVGKPPITHRVTTKPLEFTAKMPPGAEGLATLISTSDLKVSETWQPRPPASAKVGDAFTRTTTVQVRDVPGMALPPFRCEPIDGFGVYPKAPAVTDQVDRGNLTGKRVETVTYVCEQPGTFRIPERTLTWWKLDDKQLRQVRLPVRSVDVTSVAPEQPNESTPDESTIPWLWVVGLAMGFAGLFILLWVPGRRHRVAPTETDADRFAQFRTACRHGDAQAIDRTLRAWLARFAGSSTPLSVEAFAARADDPTLTSLLDGLQAEVYGRSETRSAGWSPVDLYRRVAAARSRLSRHDAGPQRHSNGLVPLNPT